MRAVLLIVVLGLALPSSGESIEIAGGREHCDESGHAVAVVAAIDLLVEGVLPVTAHAVFCSGAFIAPDVVVTAGHCLDEASFEDAIADVGTFVGVRFAVSQDPDLRDLAGGSLASLPSDAVAVTQTSVLDPELLNGDLALLFLEEPMPGAAPLIVDEMGSPPIARGTAAAVVGWGADGTSGGAGLRRCGDFTVDLVADDGIVLLGDGAGLCDGDSGAAITVPRAEGETLIGVASGGDCSTNGSGTLASAHRQHLDDELRRGCDEGFRSSCDPPGLPAAGEPWAPAEPSLPSCASTAGSPAWGLLLLLLRLLRLRAPPRSARAAR